MPSGVYKRTPEHIAKIRVALKGNQYAKGNKSNETSFKKGFTPWNKGTKGIMVAWNKGKKGWTLGTTAGFQQGNDYGKGEKNRNWQGGITPINTKIRNSSEYAKWRSNVFTRDNWTCQTCEERGGTVLHAHHIKSFARYPEERFNVNNGMTLCKPCHKQTDTYLNRWK